MKEKLSVAYMQSCQNPPVLELVNHFTKSSTVAYKQVA